MDYRVIKYFIDRDTLKEFNAGDLFPCDNPARAAQLINRCYIERIAEEDPEEENIQEVPEQEEPEPEEKAEEPKTTAKAKSTKKSGNKKKE